MALFVMAIMLLSGTVPAALRNNPVNENINGKPINPVTVQKTSSGSMAFISSASENTMSEQLSGNQQTMRAEQIIKYHSGYNSNAIGFNGAMTWEGAIRLTPTELEPYSGYSLVALNWYHYDSDTPKTGTIKIYDAGTASAPGALLATAPYTDAGAGLIRVNLASPLALDTSKDLWVSVEIVQTAAGYPFGIDAGPQIDGKGGFLYYSGAWYELQALGLDYNWVLEAVVDQLGPTPDHDLKMASIDAPVDGTALAPITPQCTVKNTGNNTETGVPVEMTISTTSVSTALEEHFEGTFPPTGWTLTQIQGSYGWLQNTYWGRGNYAGSGKCADADVDQAYSYPMECIMTSPSFSLVGFPSATLSWNNYIYVYASDVLTTDISTNGGSTWTNLYTQTGSYIYGQYSAKSYDLTPYCGNANVKIRFHYYALYWAYYWEVDDIKVYGTATVTEFDDIQTIASIAAGASTQVSFAPWTPDAWGDPAYEDSDLSYAVTAEVQLPGDMVPSNDLKTSSATLYFPFLKDVSLETIISPTASGLATTFPVKVTIKNVGQQPVRNFFTYVDIGEVGIGGTPVNEPFNSVPPAGWTDEHKSYVYYYGWYTSYSQNSGGSSPEAMLPYYYALAGYKFYTPTFDTTGYDGARLNVKSYINHYSGQGLYTLKAAVRTGYGAWNEIWSFAPSASGKFEINAELPQSTTTQVAFYFEGDPWYFNYWYIDDCKVELTYANVEYNEAQAVTNWFNPGQTLDLAYHPGHLHTFQPTYLL